ncbi:inositol oxygenase 1 [Cladorrhinum sp. PSN332]|nr:inositol oxygenase 1 [Cladorrhinum sp. PSN332]
MAPHATDLTPPFQDLVAINRHKDGAALEAISDAVDTVNQLRGALPDSPSPRYDTPIDAQPGFTPSRDPNTFRQYQHACERVKLFYAEQHAKQTVAYNLAARARFHSAARVRPEMTIWQAIEKLDTLVDDSDPDTELSQIQHLLQSAEAIRKDGKPRWMQLTGLLHDLGKLMFLLPGCCSGQWDVVGDTFPVGCQFDELCIFPEEFEANPDFKDDVYSTRYGVYEPGCGVDRLMMSWGHDEYLYLVLRDQSTLPEEALAMVRYHSFYAWHKEGAYREFMAEGDEELLRAVKSFNPYDLYSKGDAVPNVEELKPYYLELIDEYFPNKVIKW